MVCGEWVCAEAAGDAVRIAIIGALPGELKPLVQGWTKAPAEQGVRKWIHTQSADVWTAACAGMGADAARRAFAAVELDGPIDVVLSVGWAGAVCEGLEPGQVSVMTILIDAQTGERFHLTQGERVFTLVTTAGVADEREKVRLRATYPGLVAVDMEAATIARLAQMRNIPMVCIKGISDGAKAKLPDLNPFIDSRGQLRIVPFLLHVALRPTYWRSILELGKNSKIAADALSKVVQSFLNSKDVEGFNRKGYV